jgi:hypothetical protein
VADFRIPRSALRDPSDPDQVSWGVIQRMYDELKTPYELDDRLTACTLGQRALYALLDDDERTLAVVLAHYVEEHPEEFLKPASSVEANED